MCFSKGKITAVQTAALLCIVWQPKKYILFMVLNPLSSFYTQMMLATAFMYKSMNGMFYGTVRSWTVKNLCFSGEKVFIFIGLSS